MYQEFSRNILLLVHLAATAMLLSACAGVPISSYGKLAGLDPMKAEPQDILIAIQATDSIDLESAVVTMRVSFVAEDEEIDESHELEVRPTPPESFSARLAKDKEPDQQVFHYRLTAEDAAILKQFQRFVTDYRENGGAGEGSLSVSFGGFCAASPIDESSAPYTIYLKTEPGQDYFPLYRADLNDLFENTEGGVSAIPPCAA